MILFSSGDKIHRPFKLQLLYKSRKNINRVANNMPNNRRRNIVSSFIIPGLAVLEIQWLLCGMNLHVKSTVAMMHQR